MGRGLVPGPPVDIKIQGCSSSLYKMEKKIAVKYTCAVQIFAVQGSSVLYFECLQGYSIETLLFSLPPKSRKRSLYCF